MQLCMSSLPRNRIYKNGGCECTDYVPVLAVVACGTVECGTAGKVGGNRRCVPLASYIHEFIDTGRQQMSSDASPHSGETSGVRVPLAYRVLDGASEFPHPSSALALRASSTGKKRTTPL
jgi:hypothetical protein